MEGYPPRRLSTCICPYTTTPKKKRNDLLNNNARPARKRNAGKGKQERYILPPRVHILKHNSHPPRGRAYFVGDYRRHPKRKERRRRGGRASHRGANRAARPRKRKIPTAQKANARAETTLAVLFAVLCDCRPTLQRDRANAFAVYLFRFR